LADGISEAGGGLSSWRNLGPHANHVPQPRISATNIEPPESRVSMASL